MTDLLYNDNSVAPVFLLVLLGAVLRLTRLTDEALVFVVAIPALVFTKISKTKFTEVFYGIMVLLVVGSAMAFFCITWLNSYLVISDSSSRGSGRIHGPTVAPTAVVSFIMAKAIGNDRELVGNIIALSTLISMFTVGSGLFVL